jgi:hypothetical protein
MSDKADALKTTESLCHDARESLATTRDPLGQAAWMARESGNHELDKSLMSIMELIEVANRLLITVPRLKG